MIKPPKVYNPHATSSAAAGDERRGSITSQQEMLELLPYTSEGFLDKDMNDESG